MRANIEFYKELCIDDNMYNFAMAYDFYTGKINQMLLIPRIFIIKIIEIVDKIVMVY